MKQASALTHKGFTLIEILVAMAIFSLIGLASTGVLTSVIESDKLSTERFEQLAKLQRAMLTIERDVLQAVARAIRVNGEANNTVIWGADGAFDSETQGLGLVRLGWQNPQFMLPRSQLQAVSYRLQDQQLERLYGNYLDNAIGYQPKVKILLTDIDDFQVSFLKDIKNLNAPSDWQQNYTGVTLPIAIAITINSAIFGEIRREFLLARSQ
jgi:general secretion pathway protein J